MPRSRKATPVVESAERIAAVLQGFDYEIDREDFVLYEVAGLIDEDRASFDDEEFRRVIDDGVLEHIEERLHIRAKLSNKLRRAEFKDMRPEAQAAVVRIIHAVEDVHSNLRNVSAIVRSYTQYVLERLEGLQDNAAEDEKAREWIDRWRNGEILREELIANLKTIPEAAIAPAADLLFESVDDRMASEAAITVLSNIHSAAGARVLAHAISEPVLDEDLEARAFSALAASWPLPRAYMIHSLQNHAHEDIPFRWFQLFVQVDELSTVEFVLEELRAHGSNPDYREDLSSLLDVLQKTRDPDVQDKILATMNAPETAEVVRPLLKGFLQEYRQPEVSSANPWLRHATQLELNQKYIAAARLFDAGKKQEATRELDAILAVDPQYPLAVMLREGT